MIKFKITKTEDEIRELSQLARKIQVECYTPLIGAEQVEYMLSKFQSEDIISQQISTGYKYITVYKDRELAGYFGIKQEDEKLFLSKFYLADGYRGLGISRSMIDEIIRYSKGLFSIYLTVNKNNIKAISVYKKFGFDIIDSVITDIGSDFVMDDYIMEKKLF